MGVGVLVLLGVGVFVAVGDGVSVGVGVGELVAVGVSVFVGVGEFVAVGVSVFVGVGELVAVGVSVFVGVGVLVAGVPICRSPAPPPQAAIKVTAVNEARQKPIASPLGRGVGVFMRRLSGLKSKGEGATSKPAL